MTRKLSDLWTEIEPDDGTPEGNCLRSVRTEEGFTIRTYATPHVQRGKDGIAVRILSPDGSQAYWTGIEPAGLVYVAPGSPVDSDEVLISAIQLCCHDAQHDDDGNLEATSWDADTLYEEASCAESYLEGDE